MDPPQHPLHRTSRERGTLLASDLSQPPSPSGGPTSSSFPFDYGQRHSNTTQTTLPALSPFASPALPPYSSAECSPTDGTGGSLDANLRQLAVLQALVARQQALVESSASLHGHPATIPVSSASLLPALRQPQSSTPSSSFNHGSIPNPDWRSFAPSDSPVAFDSGQGIGQTLADSREGIVGGNWPPTGVTATELASAQQQLDLWSQTVFFTDSPSQSRAPTPAPTPFSPPPHPAQLHLMTHGDAPLSQSTGVDWASLYGPPSPRSLTYPASSFAPSDPASLLPLLQPQLSDQPHSNTDPSGSSEVATTPSSSATAPARGAAASRSRRGSSASTATMTTRGGGRRGSSRTTQKAAQEDEDELDFGENDPGPLQDGTPEEIEEDKRRRNTAASGEGLIL